MKTTMKAIMCTRYGAPEVLKITEVEKPTPKANEVQVKIAATSVTSADARIRGLQVPFGYKWIMRLVMGFNAPKKNILGLNFAGVIEMIGNDVKEFKIGDEVFGSTEFKMSTYAEYCTISEQELITTKPSHISFVEAVALPFGFLSALFFLKKKGRIVSGQKVLVNGASGSVGSAAVQLAKYFGAYVTGICSGINEELVRSLGADKVIDYTKQDFAKSAEAYDLILDNIGNISFSRCKSVLSKHGKLLMVVSDLPQLLKTSWINITNQKKAIGGTSFSKKEDLLFIKQLVETGTIKPVIDKSYPLEQIVDAHRYVDKKHKKGNVIITLEQNNKN